MDADNGSAAEADLRAIAAAQHAYQSANGGFYDTPACLARPETCIPGYAGHSFLEPALASLSARNGHTFTFEPRYSKSIDVFYTCQGRKDFVTEVEVLAERDVDPAFAFDGKLRVYGTIGR